MKPRSIFTKCFATFAGAAAIAGSLVWSANARATASYSAAACQVIANFLPDNGAFNVFSHQMSGQGILVCPVVNGTGNDLTRVQNVRVHGWANGAGDPVELQACRTFMGGGGLGGVCGAISTPGNFMVYHQEITDLTPWTNGAQRE